MDYLQQQASQRIERFSTPIPDFFTDEGPYALRVSDPDHVPVLNEYRLL
jgi:hypothetical protein